MPNNKQKHTMTDDKPYDKPYDKPDATPKTKQSFKVAINIGGQVMTFYTYAYSAKQAKQSAYHQLGKKLNQSAALLYTKLHNTNRVEVTHNKEGK